jgi:hypothetical protein
MHNLQLTAHWYTSTHACMPMYRIGTYQFHACTPAVMVLLLQQQLAAALLPLELLLYQLLLTLGCLVDNLSPSRCPWVHVHIHVHLEYTVHVPSHYPHRGMHAYTHVYTRVYTHAYVRVQVPLHRH